MKAVFSFNISEGCERISSLFASLWLRYDAAQLLTGLFASCVSPEVRRLFSSYALFLTVSTSNWVFRVFGVIILQETHPLRMFSAACLSSLLSQLYLHTLSHFQCPQIRQVWLLVFDPIGGSCCSLNSAISRAAVIAVLLCTLFSWQGVVFLQLALLLFAPNPSPVAVKRAQSRTSES